MIETILISLVTVLLTGGIVLYLKGKNVRARVDRIPGPKAQPIFGNALSFEKDSNAFYIQLEKYCTTFADSGICRVWFGPHPAILIYKAEFLEILFSSSKHITKAVFYKFHKPWLKTGLLTSTGEKWHARRKLITPTFHFKILEEFLGVMHDHIQVLMEILDSKVGGEAFDIQQHLAHCSLDIICDTAMGTFVDAQHKTSEYVKAIYRFSDIFMQRVRAPWLWPDFMLKFHPLGWKMFGCLKILHGFTRKVITERSAEFDRQWEKMKNEKGNTLMEEEKPIRIGKRMAFLDMLLMVAKKDGSLTHDDIQEEVDTFMFEGHDTTAAAAVWTFYVIGKYPEIQAKLQAEVDQVFGDDDRQATMEDLSQLKYTECVLKETMRLFPVVPMFGRELSEDCEIGGYFIPKGATAFAMSVPLHRDSRFFPDPEKLDPDRWMSENTANRHPFSYVPFSAGLRNCIGQRFAIMEEKLLLSSVMRKFNVTCVDPDNIGRSGLLILRPANGVHINLTKRVK